MSLIDCLSKFAKDFKNLDHESVQEASRIYQERGETEAAANIAAIEDHIAELQADRKRVSDAITEAFKTKHPKKYKQAIEKKIADHSERAAERVEAEKAVVIDARKGEFEQSVYHGSPYKFDRFTMEHIGKGEGAQAYGWGLYFAGKREIAEYYREALTARNIRIPDVVEEDIIAVMKQDVSSLPEKFQQEAKSAIDRFDTAANAYNVVADVDKYGSGEVADFLRNHIVPNADKGRLYEVNIPEDDTYLLWDKPLSEQPEKVKTALKKAGIGSDKDAEAMSEDELLGALGVFEQTLTGGEKKGAGLYKEFEAFHGSDEAASKYLHSLGIQGIKYLDGTSRAQGEGSFNYVIFDENAIEVLQTFYQGEKQEPRATFNPSTAYEIKDSAGKSLGFATGNDPASALASFNKINNTDAGKSADHVPLITLLADANLSSFLHESGHFFLSVYADIASQPDGPAEVKQDMDALLDWMGIGETGATDVVGIGERVGEFEAPLGRTRLETWNMMTLDEQRPYHERFAETFEQYLFTGKAPSLELQPLFRRFASWMKRVYQSVQNFIATNKLAKLDPTVSAIFDRMLATDQEIEAAQAARNYVNLFKTAEEGGMTPDEWADYQATNSEKAEVAAEELTARALRELKWSRNLHGRIVSELQKDAKAARSVARMEARKIVMTQPVYQAWQFLTARMPKQGGVKPKPLAADIVRPEADSMFTAIGRLGGIDKAELVSNWGVDPKTKIASGVFGKPTVRVTNGRSIDEMAEVLSQYGYLTLDENGKWDLHEFADLFRQELSGTPHYSNQFDYDTLKDDEEPIDVEASGRLFEPTLKGFYGETGIWTFLRDLGMTTNDDSGFHPDVVAEAFGFDSGDAMVRELAIAQTPNEAIEAETDRIMMDRYSELATPEAISQAADEAIHNEVSAKMAAFELLRLRKSLGNIPIIMKAAKEYAIELMGRKMVKDVKPYVFAAAEARASRAAEKALGKGDREQAAKDKRAQVLNGAATREAYAVLKEIKAGREYLRKMEKKEVRKRIGKAGHDYLEQIDALLERYELRTVTKKTMDRRASLLTWASRTDEEGNLINALNIPQELLKDAKIINWQQVPVDEFRALVETAKQIEHMARLKNSLMTAADKRNLDELAAETAEGIRSSKKARIKQLEPERGLVPWLNGFYLSHRKLSSLFRQMDGGKDDGMLWRLLTRGMNAAGAKEAGMIEDATEMLMSIFKPILAMKGGTEGDLRKIDAIGASLTRGGRMSVALNWGNEGNRDRVRNEWNDYQVQAILSTLTKAELEAVQQVWDLNESYWPLIAEKERRVTGIVPEKVIATPFSVTSSDGHSVQMRGGYYPIKYDAEASQRAEQHDHADIAKRMMAGAFSHASTKRGHLEARLATVNRPVRKSLDVMTQHLVEVIHDLSWHEWLMDANKLIGHKDVDAAIREHYGAQTVREIKDALIDIASGNLAQMNAVDRGMMHLRANISAATMGLSMTTAFLQPFGLLQSMARVGVVPVVRGMARWGGDMARMENTLAGIKDKSEVMRHRSKTMNRELHEINGRLVQGKSTARQIYEASLFMLMQKMQLIADVPTWIGVYESQITNGASESEAIAQADRAVIESQGSGQVKDLAQIQRKHPFLTMFYSYFSATFNIAAEKTAATDFRSPAQVAGWVADMALLVIVPAIGPAMITAWMRGEDDDDWEEIAKKLALETAGFTLGMVVGLREFSGALQGFDYAGPPIGRVVTDVSRFVERSLKGEMDDKMAMDSLRVTGSLLGIPSTQIVRSWRGWQEWEEGDTPPTAILMGPPRND